jgi:hypothetical protein
MLPTRHVFLSSVTPKPRSRTERVPGSDYLAQNQQDSTFATHVEGMLTDVLLFQPERNAFDNTTNFKILSSLTPTVTIHLPIDFGDQDLTIATHVGYLITAPW